jgi:hypothetical protein
MRYSLCLALFFLALTAIAAVAGGSTKPKGRVEDSAIFREVDDDNDGQLELHEIRKVSKVLTQYSLTIPSS